jgi:hypothetical protein
MIKKYWKLIAGAIVGIFGLLFIFGKKSNNKKATAAKKKIDTNNVEINKLDGKVEEIKKQKAVAKKKVTTTKKQLEATKTKKSTPKKSAPKKSVKSAKANIKKKIRK